MRDIGYRKASDTEPIDLDDLKRRAETFAPGVTDQLHNLLGCAWGRQITIPGDMDLCPAKAEQIVVLHNNGQAASFKLCTKHRDLVEAETTPHAKAVQ